MADIFDAEKAAQVAAMFIELNGGSMDRYALIKMMYDADRASCEKWGQSMTGDAPVSMEHGPVLSKICDLTKGSFSFNSSGWKQHINPADEDNIITIKESFQAKDRLSKSDVTMITDSYKKLGKCNFSQLKKWSHKLPEYEEVGKGEARPIPLEKRLAAVGRTEAQIKESAEEITESHLLKVIFSGK